MVKLSRCNAEKFLLSLCVKSGSTTSHFSLVKPIRIRKTKLYFFLVVVLLVILVIVVILIFGNLGISVILVIW